MVNSEFYGMKPDICNPVKLSGDGGLLHKTRSMITFMAHSLNAQSCHSLKNSISFGILQEKFLPLSD
jgi:hypothetical protein